MPFWYQQVNFPFQSRVPNKYFMRTWVQILGGFVSIGFFLSFLLLSLVVLYFSVPLSSIVLKGHSVLFFWKNLSFAWSIDVFHSYYHDSRENIFWGSMDRAIFWRSIDMVFLFKIWFLRIFVWGLVFSDLFFFFLDLQVLEYHLCCFSPCAIRRFFDLW